MNGLIINGSPRKGNTYTAVKALNDSFTTAGNINIFQINVSDVAVSPCVSCGYCKEKNRCVKTDDTNYIIEKIVSSDIIVFATPVYWWGISAQLKAIIDKFYCQQRALASTKKKIGLIVIGQLSTNNPQYQIIQQQFKCIADYLDWDFIFCKSYSAYNPTDLSKNDFAISEIKSLTNLF